MNKPDADFYPASDQDYFEDLQKWRESMEKHFTLPVGSTDILLENRENCFNLWYNQNGQMQCKTVQSTEQYNISSQGKSAIGIHVTLQPI